MKNQNRHTPGLHTEMPTGRSCGQAQTGSAGPAAKKPDGPSRGGGWGALGWLPRDGGGCMFGGEPVGSWQVREKGAPCRLQAKPLGRLERTEAPQGPSASSQEKWVPLECCEQGDTIRSGFEKIPLAV